MDARLLTGIEDRPYKEMPDLSAQPSLTNLKGGIPVEAAPVGARLLANQPPGPYSPGGAAMTSNQMAPPSAPPAMTPPAAPEPAPAAILAQPQPAAKPQRSAGDQALQRKMESAYKTGQMMKQVTVERREYRKAMKDYEAELRKLDTAGEHGTEMEELIKAIGKALADKPEALQRLEFAAVKNQITINRLEPELKKKAQALSKRYGLKLNKAGFIENAPAYEEDTDKAYDAAQQRGVVDLLLPRE